MPVTDKRMGRQHSKKGNGKPCVYKNFSPIRGTILFPQVSAFLNQSINQSALPSSCQSQPYSIQAGLNLQTWVSCGYAAVKLSLLIQRGQRGLSPKDTQLHHNSAEHEQCPCGLDVTRVSLTAQKGVSPRTPTYSLPFRRACKVSHSRGLPVCRCRRSYCTAPCLRPPRRVLHVA